MKYVKGIPKPSASGRRKGTPNRVTARLRESILQCYNELGGAEWLYQFVMRSEENARVFVQLLGGLVPTEITAPNGGPLKIVVEELHRDAIDAEVVSEPHSPPRLPKLH
jgi:hypothetical protein